MQCSKAVILARGLGTRMRRGDAAARLDSSQAAIADSGVKAMIPIGRPFLDYVLSALADSGFNDVCLVIGPEHDAIREHYRRAATRRLRLHFAVQQQARGTADAVLAAEQFAGGEEFVVLNSDNYYPLDVLRALRELDQPGAVMFDEAALVGNSNISPERIRSYAYAQVNSSGYLIDLIEKPDETSAASMRGNALVSMNIWRFAPEMFSYCRNVEVSPRGEYELPLAVRMAVHSGMKLRIIPSHSGVLDMSVRADISAVAARLRDIQVHL